MNLNDISLENIRFLVDLGVEFTKFIPTKTGLEKSIFDATGQVRDYFLRCKHHNYQTQQQGPDYKVTCKSAILTPEAVIPSTASYYRPVTKQGDPRMWFSGLQHHTIPFNQIVLIIYDQTPYLIDITQFDLRECYEKGDHIGQFLNAVRPRNELASTRLLDQLKQIAKQPIYAVTKGDTAIGMSLEHALGIKANSSKAPDFENLIELKSSRSRGTRTNLFAQVANWDLSECKSSGQILDTYGYDTDTHRKLYCTISTQRVNSQGLSFKYNSKLDYVEEVHSSGRSVAIWTGEVLRKRLIEKHSETFWVTADEMEINNQPHFVLKSVLHTRRPVISQLLPLIETGNITMDHLIKRELTKLTGAKEKGPLFKIHERDLNLLFPEPKTYSLAD